MAKVVKFISAFQLARLLKAWKNEESFQSILEDLIEENDPIALYIDSELDKFGYGSYYDPEYDCWEFATPPTRILAQILSKVMKGQKVFVPVDEELICRIPNPPKKWRWRQVDKCHRRWGWVA